MKRARGIAFGSETDIDKTEDKVMEEKKNTEKAVLDKEDVRDVSGGSGSFSGGYCAHTPDRTCKVEAVGGWDPDNRICAECGWRAW